MVVAVALAVALVIVLTVVLIVTMRRRARLSVTEDTGTWQSGGSLEDRLRTLIRNRQKIPAIKLVRQHTRLGLKEAKDVVDEFERTDRLWLPGEARPGWPGEPDRPGKLWGPEPGEVLERARRLKADRKAIEAIKLIRSHTGLGLKEAKDLYDEL
jgi:ribosomal protein L7/L12